MGKLVLVNEKDEVLGYETKEKCHLGKGILHRAFSVYIFNKKGELLIQQRSRLKKLWPLYWANSCCSHPRRDEDYTKAGEKRLKEEVGFTCSLELFTKFRYRARFKNIGSENELCAILISNYDGEPNPNPDEVANWKWVDTVKLKEDLKKKSKNYTPWFKIGLSKILKI